MIVYLQNPSASTKKLVEIINNFSKVAGYKINAHKSSAFLYTSNTSQKQELEKEIPFKNHSIQYKILRNLSAKTYTRII